MGELTQEVEKRVAHQIRRLTTIPGVDRIVAWTVLAEIGFDMAVFDDIKHLASWAALCPGNHESGGKRRSGRMRKGNPYLRRVLCQAAWGAARKKNSSWERIRGGLFRPSAERQASPEDGRAAGEAGL